jgi:dephospho-CoA kinase
MITIGITGTIGAGKGTIVEYLKTKGFKHYSVRAFLNKELARLDMPPTRDSMRIIADQYRKNYSPEYIMEQLLAERMKDDVPAVIESQRAVGEIDYLRTHAPHFYLFAADADPRLRYDRILVRQSSTDHVSFEKFLEDERMEMNNTEPWKMNLAACITKADFVFENNRTVPELYEQVEGVLAKILG